MVPDLPDLPAAGHDPVTIGDRLVILAILVVVGFTAWMGWRYWQVKQASDDYNRAIDASVERIKALGR